MRYLILVICFLFAVYAGKNGMITLWQGLTYHATPEKITGLNFVVFLLIANGLYNFAFDAIRFVEQSFHRITTALVVIAGLWIACKAFFPDALKYFDYLLRWL
jgi:hypothetical protein